MKRLNITLPNDVYHLLISNVKRGKISSFIAEIARKELEKKNKILADCYKNASIEASNDPDLKDWNNIDVEGWI